MVEFDQYDKLKYELFEQLLPVLLYEEKDDVGKILLEELEAEYDGAVYDLFCRLCEDDKIECPYDKCDLAIKKYEMSGIQFIELSLPETTANINHAVRAYVLTAYGRKEPEKKYVRYLYIKKFHKIGQLYVMYISKDEELQLGSEVTDYTDDFERERRIVGRDFLMVLAKELEVGEKKEEVIVQE